MGLHNVLYLLLLLFCNFTNCHFVRCEKRVILGVKFTKSDLVDKYSKFETIFSGRKDKNGYVLPHVTDRNMQRSDLFTN